VKTKLHLGMSRKTVWHFENK